MSRDLEVVSDIVQACELILEFTEGIDQEAFMGDVKTQSSVLYQLIVIGEASKDLSEDFRRNYSQIPYHEIRGLRNRLAHEYQEIDLEIVWKVIVREIRPLLTMLTPLLKLWVMELLEG